MTTRRAVPALLLALAASALTGCGGDEDTDLERAEARVTAAEKDVADAQAGLSEATTAFCGASEDYVSALDRYGDLLTSTAPTVGDVTDAGADLANPQEDALDTAGEAVEAQAELTAAEESLAQARADLKAVKAGKEPTAAPSASATPPPLAPPATVSRVKQAESEFEAARKGINDRTPIVRAAQDFNAAAVALEISWLLLFADAGCLDDEQQKQASDAVRDYTTALQASLKTAGHYDGDVDGVYGPQTVAAVEAVQKAHGLPVTGTVDKATGDAIQADVLAAGGETAQQELAATAALQQTLKLAGFWDGPVDGTWTPALTDALKDLQTELGVKPTGTVDAATVAAFEKAIAELGEPEEPSEEPEEEPSEEPEETPSETPES